MAFLETRDTGVLPSAMMASSSEPQLNVTHSEGVSGGKLLKRVLPRYPDVARDSGISGDVVLTAVVGVDGKLHDIKAITGSPVLREQAIAAAKQWLYSPFLLGGKPVETRTRITMNFTR
jgi:TonB family protein